MLSIKIKKNKIKTVASELYNIVRKPHWDPLQLETEVEGLNEGNVIKVTMEWVWNSPPTCQPYLVYTKVIFIILIKKDLLH